jgi:hypothetical protein
MVMTAYDGVRGLAAAALPPLICGRIEYTDFNRNQAAFNITIAPTGLPITLDSYDRFVSYWQIDAGNVPPSAVPSAIAGTVAVRLNGALVCIMTATHTTSFPNTAYYTFPLGSFHGPLAMAGALATINFQGAWTWGTDPVALGNIYYDLRFMRKPV